MLFLCSDQTFHLIQSRACIILMTSLDPWSLRLVCSSLERAILWRNSVDEGCRKTLLKGSLIHSLYGGRVGFMDGAVCIWISIILSLSFSQVLHIFQASSLCMCMCVRGSSRSVFKFKLGFKTSFKSIMVFHSDKYFVSIWNLVSENGLTNHSVEYISHAHIRQRYSSGSRVGCRSCCTFLSY